jgi:hypothetical protein
MTMSLAILYATFIAGVGMLIAARAWGEMPEYGQQFHGMTPMRPDLRHVLVMEEVPEIQEIPKEDIHHSPVAPLGRHA